MIDFFDNNTKKRRAPTVGIYTLGCKVNQYESRAIEEEFIRRGFEVLHHGKKCDVYVVNTCTVTAEADRKARQFIRRAASVCDIPRVIVCGCFSQHMPETVAELPGVKYVLGNVDKLSVVDAAEKILSSESDQGAEISIKDVSTAPFEIMTVTGFERTRAYIKIEDGCESKCAYCIIPKVRGRIRSKPFDAIIKEATELADSGFCEIVLTGIETCSWGKDLDGNRNLCDLLEEIDKIAGIERIRLGSLDPSFMTAPTVERLSRIRHLTPHFHLSVQNGCDRILALMRRRYNTTMLRDRMRNIRENIPDVTFTTDIMTGFPGETEADFKETLEFVEEAKFLEAHIFTYSRRPDTEADKMSGQVEEKIKSERAARLEAKTGKISAEVKRSFLGRELSVLVERWENGIARGHTPNYLEISFRADTDLRGTTVPVTVTSLSDEGLLGDHVSCK